MALALRLCGGNVDSLANSLRTAYAGVPTVTPSWLSLVLALAALSQVKLISESSVGINGPYR